MIIRLCVCVCAAAAVIVIWGVNITIRTIITRTKNLMYVSYTHVNEPLYYTTRFRRGLLLEGAATAS